MPTLIPHHVYRVAHNMTKYHLNGQWVVFLGYDRIAGVRFAKITTLDEDGYPETEYHIQPQFLISV